MEDRAEGRMVFYCFLFGGDEAFFFRFIPIQNGTSSGIDGLAMHSVDLVSGAVLLLLLLLPASVRGGRNVGAGDARARAWYLTSSYM